MTPISFVRLHHLRMGPVIEYSAETIGDFPRSTGNSMIIGIGECLEALIRIAALGLELSL